MKSKKLIIYLMIMALVAAGGFFLWGVQTEGIKDMDEEKGIDSDMDNSDNEMTDDDKMMNEGEKAPDFTLMSVDGMEYTLSDFEGEKVYLKFWASWCPVCLSGLEELDELSAKDDFPVLTIVSPGYGSEMNSEDFVEWFKGLDEKNIIVLLDDEGTIASKYFVRGYPTSAYIGSDGVLVKTLPGHSSNETIKNTVEGIY